MNKTLRLLKGNDYPNQSSVLCIKEDSTDFVIVRKTDHQEIGTDKSGSDWCKASLASAKGGVVCAPEDSTDFAFFRISDEKQIGQDISGNDFCRADFTNEFEGIVCAPEDSTDFAVFRVSDGKQIGEDISGKISRIRHLFNSTQLYKILWPL